VAGECGGFGGFLSMAASRFPGKVAPQPFATTAVFLPGGIVGGGGQAGRLRRAFLSVAALRFAGKVALGLGLGFTGVTKSVLTLHSSGTGRMRSLYGL